MSTLRSPHLPEHPAAYASPSLVDRREYMDLGHRNSVLPVIRSSMQAQRLLGFHAVTRRKREMVPPEKKDAAYISKRLKNNEAAKRSREKRRLKELLLGGQLLALSDENARLRDQVLRVQYLSMCAGQVEGAPGRDLCPVYSPAVSKSLVWEENWRNPHRSIPPFSWNQGFDSPFQSSGLMPFSGPRFPSAVAGTERTKADSDANRQVAFSAQIKADAASFQAFLPRPDMLHPAPMLPHPPPTWLVPSPAVSSNFVVPWLSPYLASTPLHQSLPLCMQEMQGQGLGEDAQMAFKGRFNAARAPHF